jgi:long-chain acyl-CoA synthetase
MSDVDLDLTIPDLFLRAVRDHANEPALLTATDGVFTTTTWSQLVREVARHAAALGALDLPPGGAVAQWSENRREWVLFDLACHFAGLVHVPLHASLSAEQAVEQIIHSGARLVVASETLVDKLAAVREQLGECLVYSYGQSVAPDVFSWPARVAAGEARPLPPSRVRPHDVATLLYTSGTTGQPKAVPLTQRNLSFNAQALVAAYGPAPRDTKLCVLPLSHIFARTCDLYAWLVRGSTLALVRSRDTVLEDLQLVRPTTINGVPYFFERLRKLLASRGLVDSRGALSQLLGGRIRSCSSGGAALAPATIAFFEAQGVPLLQGYGLTEASPVVTLSPREKNRLVTCGLALPGVELQIADDGEVLTRGPHVMTGYWNDALSSQAVLHDGWLHTGDLGSIDADGYLRIVGRKKELLVLSTGKKVWPQAIEQRLLQDPLVEQAMVVGEGRGFIAALVVLNGQALPSLIARLGGENDRLHAYLLERLQSQTGDLARHEQPQRIAILERPFSEERGELTPKLSLRREVIASNFAREIETIYAS